MLERFQPCRRADGSLTSSFKMIFALQLSEVNIVWGEGWDRQVKRRDANQLKSAIDGDDVDACHCGLFAAGHARRFRVRVNELIMDGFASHVLAACWTQCD